MMHPPLPVILHIKSCHRCSTHPKPEQLLASHHGSYSDKRRSWHRGPLQVYNVKAEHSLRCLLTRTLQMHAAAVQQTGDWQDRAN